MSFIVHRKVLVSMLFVGLSLLGYLSYKSLKTELMPNMEYAVLHVKISIDRESDKTYIENYAAIPVEGAVSSMEGVKEVETTVNERGASVTAFYSTETNMQHAYIKLEEKLKGVEKQLPEEFKLSLREANLNFDANQFMQIEIKGTGGIDAVRRIADDEIVNHLLGIDGIADVQLLGGRKKSIEVVLDHDRCEALGVSPSQVAQIIRGGQLQKQFLGQVYDGKQRLFVNMDSEYLEVNDLNNLVIKAEGPVLLSEVADVSMGLKKQENYSRVDGKDAISGVLVKTEEANLIAVSDAVKLGIAELNKSLESQGVSIGVENNMADMMEENIDRVKELALLGALLAIIVLWLFLRNLGMVSIVTLAIPISVLTSFNLFFALGLTVNMLTLIGIAMAVGMLLDNSVVVIENIYRLRSLGEGATNAAVQGTKEVARAVLASTLTTITVFVPFLFSSEPNIQVLGKHIGLSIIITLLVSLVVALILIPMIARWFLRDDACRIKLQSIPFYHRLMQFYVLLLKMCLRKPLPVILGGIMLFFVTVLLCLSYGVENLKEMQTGEYSVYVTMPGGSDLEHTDAVVRELEDCFLNYVSRTDSTQKGIVGIERILSDVREQEAKLTLIVDEDFEETRQRKLTDIRKDIITAYRPVLMKSEAQITMYAGTSSKNFRQKSSRGNKLMQMMGVGRNQERIVIKGNDFESMTLLASDFEFLLNDSEDDIEAWVSFANGDPEIHLYFNTLLMELFEIRPTQVLQELQTFQKESSANTVFKDGFQECEVIIKDLEAMKKEEENIAAEKNLQDLQTLTVTGAAGANHELRSFSKFFKTTGDADIIRKNQVKEVEVLYTYPKEYYESKELLETARKGVDDLLESVYIPPGIAVDIIRDENEVSEFTVLFLAAFLLILMILASVFESVVAPFVLMFSIPLAAIGSFLALFLTQNSLMNMTALTGFIILLGLVVNNGIILIDYVRILRQQGYRRSRAIIHSGISRVRPILITTITSIVALLPMAMDTQEYAGALGAPFAITVIGGLLTSTLLTLVFIPTLYTAVEEALYWMKGLHWSIILVQAVVFLGGSFLIYMAYLDTMWKVLYICLLFLAVEGLTYFSLKSFRRGTENLIDKEQPIYIRIVNLVKIYDREGRFKREWQAGLLRRKKLGLEKQYTHIQDFADWVWKLPLCGFCYYLAYGYLEKVFWIFLFAVFAWHLGLSLFRAKRLFFTHHFSTRFAVFPRLLHRIERLYFWLSPLVTTYFLWEVSSWKGVAVFLGLCWYFFIIVNRVATKVQRERIQVDAITGRFGAWRRLLYKLVAAIPIVGRKKQPFRANASISLDIRPGMFGLLGPNGAGKTTLMRIICGILNQSYGKIYINGIDTQVKREELQGLIGYLPQEFGTYENMTAFEYLDYQALLKGLSNKQERRQRMAYVLEAVHMTEHQHKKIGSFSGGMKQRIGIAQTLLHLPRILVVDEPTAGLDPRERIRFRNLLVSLSRSRVVIFSTHIIEDIASSCNQIAVINKGTLQYHGRPQDMTSAAVGKVWTFEVPASDFATATQGLLVINHVRKGEIVKVRCLGDSMPHPEAQCVTPFLEDAYLYLLRQ